MTIIYFLIIGLIAGWMAGLIMQGRGFGVIGNIVVGIIGALIGGYITGWLGIQEGGVIASILTSVLGAVVLLGLVSLVRRDASPL